MLVIDEKARQHLLAHGGEKMEKIAIEVYEYHRKHGSNYPYTPMCMKFETILGKSECIGVDSVNDSDVILVQKRTGRNKWSRAVREPSVHCRAATVIVDRMGKLITAYIGYPAPREPWDKSMNATQKSESVEFWRNHALCLQEGAETALMTYWEFCNG